MQNIVIQQYLQDPKIPFQNRKNLALDLDTQKVDETTAIQIINTKYPSRYGLPEVKQPEVETPVAPVVPTVESETSVEKIKSTIPTSDFTASAGGLGDKIKGAVSKIGDIFTKKAPPVEQPFIQKITNLNPLMPYMPARNELLASAADKLAKKYNWTEHTKESFLNMEPEKQNQLMEGFGEDTLGSQVKAGVKDFAGNLGNLLYEHTAKPVLEQGATVVKGAQALGTSLPQILKGDYEEALKTFDKVASQPMEIGDTNYNIATQAYDPETGEIDEDKLSQLFQGQQLESAGGALNLASFGSPRLAGSFWYNMLAGASSGAGESIKGGENIPVTLINAGARGLLQGTIAKVYSYAAKKATLSPTEKALYKKDIGEQARNVFKDKANQKIATEYIDDALTKIDDVKSVGAWKQPIAEVNKYMDDLAKVGKDLGQKVSTSKESLKGIKVDPSPIKSSIDDLISKVNAKTSGRFTKSIDFTGSDLAGAPSNSLNLLDDIYRASQKKSMDARELESLTSVIDTIKGFAKTAGIKNPTLNAGLGNVKTAINQTVGQYSDDFAQANKDFAIWKTGYDKIRNAMKVGSGNNITYDPQSMLSKSLIRGGSEKYAGIYQTIDDLANRYGVSAPANLKNKAWISYWAEAITNTAPARSAENVIGVQALKQVVPSRTARAALSAVDIAKKAVGGGDMNPIRTYATSVKDILQKAMDAGGKIPNKALYEALAIITNIERVAQNPITAPTVEGLTEETYGETSPEDFTYESPYITEEYTGL